MIPGADARKYDPDPKKRIEKNVEEGRGLKLFGKGKEGGVFDFASSNPLWRATLNTLDFMPILNASYSGGIIITDWYSDNNNPNESIKISIRFLTNEVRSDALDIKIFNRKCDPGSFNCKFTDSEGTIVAELKNEIIKKAAIYNEQDKERKN